MLTRAIRIHDRGDVDVMRWDEVETGEPGTDEVLIRNTAVGLNFIDPGHRSGVRTEARYETPLPMILGTEGAGTVEKLGPGVTSFEVGDRVGYWYSPPGGAYCQARVYPTARLVKLPPHITEEMAAAVLCKGMTANMLVRHAYPVKAGDTVKQRQPIGKTGETGLAAGDHLHFGVYLHGVPILPVEWWDEKWIRDNVEPKLEGKSSESVQEMTASKAPRKAAQKRKR